MRATAQELVRRTIPTFLTLASCSCHQFEEVLDSATASHVLVSRMVPNVGVQYDHVVVVGHAACEASVDLVSCLEYIGPSLCPGCMAPSSVISCSALALVHPLEMRQRLWADAWFADFFEYSVGQMHVRGVVGCDLWPLIVRDRNRHYWGGLHHHLVTDVIVVHAPVHGAPCRVSTSHNPLDTS